MKNLINKIGGNKYKILNLMYENRIKTTDGEIYIPLTQADIASILNISTITINKYFKELKGDNLLLSSKNKKNKYLLTEKAIKIIETIKNLEKELEEG